MNEQKQAALVSYGIQNEQSDIRAHVCPHVRRVYVFPTQCGRDALPQGIETPAHQNGVVGRTALVRWVPIKAIRHCASVGLSDEVWQYVDFHLHDDLSTKGRKAVSLVAGMLKVGLFPLPLGGGEAQIIEPKHLQVRGQDIFVTIQKQQLRVQVKCDYKSGERRLGGTGNLCLQIAERNPLGLH